MICGGLKVLTRTVLLCFLILFGTSSASYDSVFPDEEFDFSAPLNFSDVPEESLSGFEEAPRSYLQKVILQSQIAWLLGSGISGAHLISEPNTDIASHMVISFLFCSLCAAGFGELEKDIHSPHALSEVGSDYLPRLQLRRTQSQLAWATSCGLAVLYLILTPGGDVAGDIEVKFLFFSMCAMGLLSLYSYNSAVIDYRRNKVSL